MSAHSILSTAKTPAMVVMHLINKFQTLDVKKHLLGFDSRRCAFHQDINTIRQNIFASDNDDNREDECAHWVEVFGPWVFAGWEDVDHNGGEDDANT